MSGWRQQRIVVKGRVQGVGMRPFLFQQATALGLCGQACNTAQGVEVLVQGAARDIDGLVAALANHPPAHALVQNIERTDIDTADFAPGFRILPSKAGAIDTALPPDRATCDACLAEMFDPANRRSAHPFISCTQCGPRHSIVRQLPWDRCRTTMAVFAQCDQCLAEIADPADRRFHSQTNGCHQCGPRLQLLDCAAGVGLEDTNALDAAIDILRGGGLLALKGLGGFHLVARADLARPLHRLRQLKQRQRKPFAVMFADTGSADEHCHLSEAERQQLASAQAPIVLLQRRVQGSIIDPLVAPGLDRLGAILAYTPLHHLLLRGVGVPLVATSANLRGEPLCYANANAIDAFAGSVDALLLHDRDIHHPLDDSIVQIAAGRPMTLRRARGFDLQCAPLGQSAATTLAVGADLKNCTAFNRGREIFSTAHLGELDSIGAEQEHAQRLAKVSDLYGLQFARVACDLHPDYRSREIAVASGLPLTSIQHHRAHLHAVLAENPDVGRPLLAAIWDGTGYGEDGTIWGGEFFVCDAGDERRVACLRPFQLPGGEQSIRQPRRIALSLLYGLLGESAEHHPALPDFMEGEIRVLLRMLQQNIHSPLCSSMGRLFDGVAALLGIHPRSDYEGEAAVCLEQLASRYPDILQLSPYPLALDRSTSPWQLDWRPMLRELLDEAATGGVPCALPAARFHLSLAHAILNVADALGITQLLVGGGCWQNRLLLETLVALAGKRDMQVCWPRSLPPGDGGIAVGQLVAAHCAVE